MRPIIAVTSSEILRSGDEWAPVVHGQSCTYINAIINSGGTPFIVPVIDQKQALRQLYKLCSGLLLSGGGDIDPALYGAKPTTKLVHLSHKRDSQELQLLKWAIEDKKPVLGVCRGMQLINVGLGGSLHQNILDSIPGAQNHEVSALQKDFKHLAHTLKILPDSKLAKILGKNNIKTNALHHQAIESLGDNLIAVAHAEDGIIEAVELKGKQFVIGVQSHPESLEEITEPLWSKLFKTFVKEAL